jgi:1-acyl-sn-glycerol-3-phosphate acyltransferase
MLLYRLLRPLVRLALQVFFKKIYLHGVENLPKNRPFIIAGNHQTAFFEPILLACFLPMPVHSMSRGDMFAKPFFRKMLTSMNMIPIFRFRNGFGGLRQNGESFEKSYEVLKKNGSILIFSEGNVSIKKRLRSLQKGTARMALGAVEAGVENMCIVPVGISYTYADQPRCEAMIEIGQLIELQPFMNDYILNEQRGITQLTKAIHTNLLPLVVHIEAPKNDELAEKHFLAARNAVNVPIFPVLNRSNVPFLREKNIANQINSGEITTAPVPIAPQPHSVALKILLWIPYIIGSALNWLPFTLATRFVERKVDEIEFKAPILFAVTLFIYLLSIPIVTLISVFFWGWKGILGSVAWLFCGYMAVIYKDR